jgi:hypothetical protein
VARAQSQAARGPGVSSRMLASASDGKAGMGQVLAVRLVRFAPWLNDRGPHAGPFSGLPICVENAGEGARVYSGGSVDAGAGNRSKQRNLQRRECRAAATTGVSRLGKIVFGDGEPADISVAGTVVPELPGFSRSGEVV